MQQEGGKRSREKVISCITKEYEMHTNIQVKSIGLRVSDVCNFTFFTDNIYKDDVYSWPLVANM